VGTVEFVPLPAQGRVFRAHRQVYLGDVGVDGQLRLAALARFLQDVATDDADDAGLADGRGAWVVRRVDLEIAGRPAYGDRVELTTFCSGTGPRWAERRTRVSGESGSVLVEAVSLWVLIDRASGRPVPLGEDFYERFGESAAGRRVTGRLRHGAPPPRMPTRPWPLRLGDFDVLDHLNNARAFEAIDDELARSAPDSSPVRAEVEYRGSVERGEEVALVRELRGEPAQLAVWLVVGDAVRISAVVSLAAAVAGGAGTPV
jgi:acyl-ACP thioesterase